MDRLIALAVIAGLAGCGGTDGGALDAALDAAPVPLLVTGAITELDTGAGGDIDNAPITAFSATDDIVALAMTRSTNGTFAITIPTAAGVFDGYLHATQPGFLDTSLYPGRPLDVDTGVAIDTEMVMLTEGTLATYAALMQVSQQPDRGFLLLRVVDSSNALVAGVVISASPAGTVRYTRNGVPSSAATATESSGVAFIANLVAGPVTVTATKAGASFGIHVVQSRAGQVTMLVVR